MDDSSSDWKKLPVNLARLEDRIPQETKIVLGMTGGIDSTVAAFLLKKRGFQCFGVSLVFLNEEQIKKSIQKRREDLSSAERGFSRTRSKTKYRPEEENEFLQGNCSGKKLDDIKKICEQLGMPFYGVNAQEEFDELIMDRLLSSKSVGENFNPCVGCNQLKMDILLKKADFLKADFIATGHFAKVYKTEKDNTFHLIGSNDEEFDQSHLLSHLKQYQLSRLILPLADLRKSEVIKIAEKFQLGQNHQRDSRKICFISQGTLAPFIEMRIPESLRPSGPILEHKGGLQLGEHYGVHHLHLGQKNLLDKSNTSIKMKIERDLTIVEIDPSGPVYVGQESECQVNSCSVEDVNLAPHIEQGRPLKVFVKYTMSCEKMEALLIFKNNSNCLLHFSRPLTTLVKGQHLTFYNKAGLGGKVLGSGRVFYTGDLSLINRVRTKETEKRDENGETIDTPISSLRF